MTIRSAVLCHSEPVTDVTGVGIRVPEKGERIAASGFALLAMAGIALPLRAQGQFPKTSGITFIIIYK